LFVSFQFYFIFQEDKSSAGPKKGTLFAKKEPGPRRVASLTRTPSLTRDLPASTSRNSGHSEPGAAAAVVAALTRSLSRPLLSGSREAGQSSDVSGPADSLAGQQQWSQTLPRSYKINGGSTVVGHGSGGGPQLAAAWRDAVAKASTVLSRSSSRSSLKQAEVAPATASSSSGRSAAAGRLLSLQDEQQDFAHTLPKSYTQLRSAMADNELLAPRTAEQRSAMADSELLAPRTVNKADKGTEVKTTTLPVQTVLTVQV
jgi:hypothetical protein